MQYFAQNIQPSLKKNRDYYDGTGQEIMKRTFTRTIVTTDSEGNKHESEVVDTAKPNNKIVKNYCKTTVDNFRGYICGQPITYAANDNTDISSLLDCFKDNDIINSDSEWLKNALIYGMAPQLCYINEKNEKKFRNLSPEQVIPIYSADLDEELLYCIYFYPVVDWDREDWHTTYSVNVYDAHHIYHYVSDDGFNSFKIDGEPEQHFFGEVPFSIFYLNDDCTSIFDCIISLQDAYNKLLSDSVNDWEAFCDAYMVLTGGMVDEDDLENMRHNRIILSDDDMSVSYLTKNTTDTQVMNLLDEINTAIHTIANSPDFSSEEFGSGVSSGIALQFKLVGFNNIASNIEAQFRKAIKKRIELLNTVFSLLDTSTFDIEISFTHNLPANIADTANVVNQLRGLVSDETLLAQIPFVSDVEQELERVKAENELSLDSLYDFGEEVDDGSEEIN